MIKTSNYGNYLNNPPLTREKKTNNIRLQVHSTHVPHAGYHTITKEVTI